VLSWFKRNRAIAMPDHPLSASDAGRILAATRNDRERAKVRAVCRELHRIAGTPVPPILDR